MGKRRSRAPTLADVADRAGMSKAAVSMILNDRPGSRLSEEAARRVRSVAEEMGYRPNPAARSLRLGTTRTIGFVSDEVTLTRHASDMIRGTLDTARGHEHTVLMAEAGGDPAQLNEAIEQMVDRRVDGILLGLMSARLIDPDTSRVEVPLVIVNGRTTSGHASVLPDEHAAGRAVAELLLDAGHRRVGVIGPLAAAMDDPTYSVTIPDRFAGIHEVFAERGVEELLVETSAWDAENGFERTDALIDTHPEVTAILAANDSVAFGVYQALSERGLRIPADMSVASFDNEVLASLQRPGLTTVHLPYEEMARRGVEMLLGDRPRADELVPMPVVVRDSVAAPSPHVQAG